MPAKRRRRIPYVCLAVVSLCAVLGAGPLFPLWAQAGPITDDNVAERVGSAKTAEEHQALAAYFHTQAAAQAQAFKAHEAMMDTWQKATAGRPLENMREHCKSAMSASRKLQRDYEAFAKEQEALATAAK